MFRFMSFILSIELEGAALGLIFISDKLGCWHRSCLLPEGRPPVNPAGPQDIMRALAGRFCPGVDAVVHSLTGRAGAPGHRDYSDPLPLPGLPRRVNAPLPQPVLTEFLPGISESAPNTGCPGIPSWDFTLINL